MSGELEVLYIVQPCQKSDGVKGSWSQKDDRKKCWPPLGYVFLSRNDDNKSLTLLFMYSLPVWSRRGSRALPPATAAAQIRQTDSGRTWPIPASWAAVSTGLAHPAPSWPEWKGARMRREHQRRSCKGNPQGADPHPLPLREGRLVEIIWTRKLPPSSPLGQASDSAKPYQI